MAHHDRRGTRSLRLPVTPRARQGRLPPCHRQDPAGDEGTSAVLEPRFRAPRPRPALAVGRNAASDGVRLPTDNRSPSPNPTIPTRFRIAAPDPITGTGTARSVREQWLAQIPWSGDRARKTRAHRKSGAAASGTRSGPATLVPVVVPIRVRRRGPGASRTFAWKGGGTPYGRAPGLQRI